VEDEGVRVVVIDSLNGYLTAMTSERFLLAQLQELLAYLNAHEVLTNASCRALPNSWEKRRTC
jgi:circadian clock protein KaiC